jgi:hypothetical protein
METRTKPGAMAGYDRLTRVKMTQVAADPTGPGFIFVQIFIFRDNPLKYTDPDGRITGWHLGGALLVAGGAVIAIGGSVLSNGTMTVPSLKAGSEMIASGLVMIGIGEKIENTPKSTGQNLTNKVQAAAPSPAPQQPNNNDDNKKSNMRKLSENEIIKRTGTDVHDVKDTIRGQYFDEMKETGVSRNFDIYENNGEVIIKGNQGGAELNLKIDLESLGVD